MQVQFSANQITRWLVRAVAILTAVHFACQFSAYVLKRGSLFGLVQFFDLNGEANAPTFYSAGALAFCAALLALIGYVTRQQGKPHRAWYALSAIILFLSLDEGIAIHERLEFLKDVLKFSSSFHYLWVIPYALLTLIIGLAFVKFVIALPARTRRQLALASAVFVFGAIGLEILGGWFASRSLAVTYFLGGIEEVFEMVGVIIAIHALLSYIESEFKGFSLSLGSAETFESQSEINATQLSGN